MVRDHDEGELDRLVELVTDVVEPNSWMEVGGLGTIRSSERTLSLVIRQTQEVHREISDLLDQLRRIHDIRIDVQTEVVTVSEEWLDDVEFETTDNLREQRFVILSNEQTVELRTLYKPERAPKVRLFNGQTVELIRDGRQILSFQPIGSANRKQVEFTLESHSRARQSGEQISWQDGHVPTGVPVLFDITGVLPPGEQRKGFRSMLLITSEVRSADARKQ